MYQLWISKCNTNIDDQDINALTTILIYNHYYSCNNVGRILINNNTYATQKIAALCLTIGYTE